MSWWKMNDNLPPGVTISMIPGCRPEDDEWFAALEQAEEQTGYSWDDPEYRQQLEDIAVDIIEMWHFRDECDLEDAAEAAAEMRRREE